MAINGDKYSVRTPILQNLAFRMLVYILSQTLTMYLKYLRSGTETEKNDLKYALEHNVYHRCLSTIVN